MASPTFDTAAINSTWAATSSATVTLSTTATNELISVAICIENAAAARTVSSVTSTSGLVWTKRSSQSTTNNVLIERWWAFTAAIVTSEVITVTLSGSIDAGCLIASSVHGLFNPGLPYDPNVGVPISAVATSTPPAATYSTTNVDDLLIAIYCSNNSTGVTAPAGWTKVISGVNGSGASRFCTAALYAKSVTGAQTSQTFTATASGLNNVLTVDAYTADTQPNSGSGILSFGGIAYSSSSFEHPTTTIILTAGTTWTVPADWNSLNNSIKAFGSGGNGSPGVAATRSGASGGSGGYSEAVNQTLTPASTVNIQLGVGGSGNTTGNDTFLKNNAGSAIVLAQSGTNASGTTAGNGGGVVRVVGSTTTAGTGGTTGPSGTTKGSVGGPGAPGPNGVGAASVTNGGNLGSSGGGGANGGSVGVIGTATTGGNGGNNRLSTGAGTGGTTVAAPTSGSNGGGSGGGSATASDQNGAVGTYEPLYTATVGGATIGPGGGPGGGGSATTSGNGGNAVNGAGGAGGANTATDFGTGGSGGNAFIVIRYVPAVNGVAILSFSGMSLVAAGTRTHSNNGTGVMSFTKASFVGAGTVARKGIGVISFGGIKYVASGRAPVRGNTILSFGGVSYTASGKIAERGIGILSFSKVSYNSAATDSHTSSGTMSFSKVSYTASGKIAERGTGILSFGGIKYVASGSDNHRATAILAFSGVSYAASGQKSGNETGTGTLSFSKVSYTVSGQKSGNETGTGVLSFLGMSIISAGEGTVAANRHFSFSSFQREDHKDWATESYTSFMDVFQVPQDTTSKSQTPYLYTFIETPEAADAADNGAFLSAGWDWADRTIPDNVRITDATQVYDFRENYLVSSTKRKVRGRGRSLSLHFENDGDKDFNLLGWVLTVQTNNSP